MSARDTAAQRWQAGGDQGWRTAALRAEVAMLREHVQRNTEAGRRRRRRAARAAHDARFAPVVGWQQSGRRMAMTDTGKMLAELIAAGRTDTELVEAVLALVQGVTELEWSQEYWFPGARPDDGLAGTR